MNKEEINKRFDERFKNHESCNNEGCLCKRHDRIKSFIYEEIERAVAEREQEIVEVIEKYFKGLVVIPHPELTKDKLLSLISKDK